MSLTTPEPLPQVEDVRTVVSPPDRHFHTDHLLRNLERRAVSSGVITAAAQAGKFVLNLGGVVVLGRLLSPEEFGLVAMVGAVTAFLGLFKEAGLSTATVQKEALTQEQVTNLFWINVGLSALIGVVSMAVAVPVAWFYRDPRLIGIMLALSATFPLTGSTVQHQALLARQMRFKVIGVIDVVSLLAGIAVASAMAVLGFGYWSLVGMQLTVATGGLCLTWWASGWRPSLPSWGSGVRPMLRFGAHLTASNMVGRLARGSDSILVGRFFGAEALGYYSRAGVLLARPLEQLLAPVSAVLIPVLSRLHDDPVRYRRAFLRAFDTLAVITFAFSASCLALSEPLVLVLLGPRWESTIPMFAGFTTLAVYLPMMSAASWLFTSQGRGRDLLSASLMMSGLTVAAYFVGLPWGPVGVVLAFSISGFLGRLPLFFYLAGRHGSVKTADLWDGFLWHLPVWAGVFLGTSLARVMLGNATPVVQLLLCGPAGLLAGGAVVSALKRPRESAMYALNTVIASTGRTKG